MTIMKLGGDRTMVLHGRRQWSGKGRGWGLSYTWNRGDKLIALAPGGQEMDLRRWLMYA